MMLAIKTHNNLTSIDAIMRSWLGFSRETKVYDFRPDRVILARKNWIVKLVILPETKQIFYYTQAGNLYPNQISYQQEAQIMYLLNNSNCEEFVRRWINACYNE